MTTLGKPKPVNEHKTRKGVQSQLEDAIRELVWWRDSGICIEAATDGGRCGGGNQWGHFISRHNSPWLAFTISTFVQCRNHNGIHAHDTTPMTIAINKLLGPEWIESMYATQRQYVHIKPNKDDLKCRLEVYRMLLAHRPSIYTVAELLAGGYYG